MVSHNQLRISMIEMGFPLHIIDLIRNMYRKQQPAIRSAAGMTEWFKIGRGVRQGCILSPWLFNLYAEAAMRETLDGYNKEFRIGGRVINNPLYKAVRRVRRLSPWFDGDFGRARRRTKLLERRYRRSKSHQDRAAWVAQVREMHAFYRKERRIILDLSYCRQR